MSCVVTRVYGARDLAAGECCTTASPPSPASRSYGIRWPLGGRLCARDQAHERVDAGSKGRVVVTIPE